MKKQISYAGGILLSLTMLLSLIIVPQAQAEDNIRVNVGATTTVRSKILNASSSARVNARAEVKTERTEEAISKAKNRANQEIDRRIDALNKLATRVSSMKKVSDAQKASISVNIQTQIATLNTLKVKITADTDLETLKTDIKSITGSYRIFALIMPQTAILAAVDRVYTIAESFTSVSVKIQAKITEAKTAGKDTTAIEAFLSSMNTKVADAKVKADLAKNGVINLTPDQGNTTQAEANRAALAQARANLKISNQDLKTARQNLESIRKALKDFNLKVSATSSVSN